MVPRSAFHSGSTRNDRVARRRVPRWLAAMPVLFLIHLAVAAEARQVLVALFQQSTIAGEHRVRLRAASGDQTRTPGSPSRFSPSFWTSREFGGDRYELTVSTYLHEKYADQPLDAVLVAGDDALKFILRYRDRLFPGVPVVHVGGDAIDIAIDAVRCRRMWSACLSRTTLPAPSSRRSNGILVQRIWSS